MEIQKFTPTVQQVFKNATLLAKKAEHRYIEAGHVLMALVAADKAFFFNKFSNDESIYDAFLQKTSEVIASYALLENGKISPSKAVKKILKIADLFFNENKEAFDTTKLAESISETAPELQRVLINFGFITEPVAEEKQPEPEQAVESSILVDISYQSENGFSDPFVGREDVLEQLAGMLASKSGKLPLVLGEKASGKTSLANGLSHLLRNSPSHPMHTYKVLYTDAETIFAENYRSGMGEVESLFELLQNNHGILFIDNFEYLVSEHKISQYFWNNYDQLSHPIVVCANAQQFTKAKNKLPFVLPQTTQITLNRPNVAETVEMLNAQKDVFEVFNKLKLNKLALKAAASLAYLIPNNTGLPAAAFDLLDSLAARKKLTSKKTPRLIKTLRKQPERKQESDEKQILWEQQLALATSYFKLRRVLIKLQISKGNKQVIKKTQNQINEANTALQGAIEQTALLDIEIMPADVILWISEKSNISEALLRGMLNPNFDHLTSLLQENITGQATPVEKAIETLARNHSGLSVHMGATKLLFTGMSGTGKTMLANKLALHFLGSELFTFNLDISEFTEPEAALKILKHKISEQQQLLITLEGIDKVSKTVLSNIIRFSESDSFVHEYGQHVALENCIFVAMSNAGSSFALENLERLNSAGKDRFIEEIAQEGLQSLEIQVGKSILHKFDEIVSFNPLTFSNIIEITTNKLKNFNNKLMNAGIETDIDETAIRFLAKKAYKPGYGAYGTDKAIDTNLINKLLHSLQKPLEDIDKLSIFAKQNQLYFETDGSILDTPEKNMVQKTESTESFQKDSAPQKENIISGIIKNFRNSLKN